MSIRNSNSVSSSIIPKWIIDMRLYFLSKYSTVFLVETNDIMRTKQIVELLSSLPTHFLKKVYRSDNTYYYVLPKHQVIVDVLPIPTVRDILIKSPDNPNKVFNKPIEIRETPSLENILIQLYKQMSMKPSIVILNNVYDEKYAKVIEPILVKVASNYHFYKVGKKGSRKEISDTHPIIIARENNHFYTPIKYPNLDEIIDYPSIFIVITPNILLFSEHLRNIATIIEIPPSVEYERQQLVEKHARVHGVNYDSDFVKKSAGLNLHETETAILMSIRKYNAIKSEILTQFKIEKFQQMGYEYIEPKRGFESVGGYEPVKEFLKKNVIELFKNPEEVKKYGLGNPRGLLLFGPPGTGKTWLSKALAKEVGLAMISVSASDILSKYVGESERKARQLAKLCEAMSPVIVFIDEADQLFRSRETTISTDSGASQRVTNILLQWLGDEDRKSYIIMSTNNIHQLDWASIRTGRIDYSIPIFYPDFEARKEILRLHTEILNKPEVPVEVDYDEIATRTLLYSSSDLKQLTDMAKNIARIKKANKITTEHFLEALRKMRVNIEMNYDSIKKMLEYTRTTRSIVIPVELEEYAKKVIEEYEKKHVELTTERW